MPVLERMAEIGLPLCVHGEVTDPEVDIFDREAVFIERVLAPLRDRLPELRIVMEHVTTADGVAFVEGGREHRRDDHRAPPDARPERAPRRRHPAALLLPAGRSSASAHRPALRRAATGGDPRFFLGTDSAPHAGHAKEAACGCAGVLLRAGGARLPRAGLRGGGRARPARGLREPQRPGLLRPAAERGAAHARAERPSRRRCRPRSRPGAGPVVVFDPGRPVYLAREGTERKTMFGKRLSVGRGDGAADRADAARDPGRALPQRRALQVHLGPRLAGLHRLPQADLLSGGARRR